MLISILVFVAICFKYFRLPDYHASYVRILIRHEFEKNKNVTDMTKARQLVLETEERMRNYYCNRDVSDCCKFVLLLQYFS